jgi:hypothetical protein
VKPQKRPVHSQIRGQPTTLRDANACATPPFLCDFPIYHLLRRNDAVHGPLFPLGSACSFNNGAYCSNFRKWLLPKRSGLLLTASLRPFSLLQPFSHYSLHPFFNSVYLRSSLHSFASVGRWLRVMGLPNCTANLRPTRPFSQIRLMNSNITQSLRL